MKGALNPVIALRCRVSQLVASMSRVDAYIKRQGMMRSLVKASIWCLLELGMSRKMVEWMVENLDASGTWKFSPKSA